MRRLSITELASLATFGFGLGMISAILEPGLLGFKVLELAPDRRNTVLGLVTFAGLVVALLTQPVMGALSDRTQSAWGRRLPFFGVGTAAAIVGLVLVLLAPSWAFLLAAVIGLQVATNTIQGPYQALIPDYVPDEQRGMASGVKLVCEGIAAVAGRVVAGQLFGLEPVIGGVAPAAVIAVPILCLLVALGITSGAIRNQPNNPETLSQPIWTALKNTFTVDLNAYPAFRWWFLNRLLFWMALIAVSVFLLFFAIDVLGLTRGQAQETMGRVTGVLGVALVLCAVPVSRLADRLPRKPMVAVAGVVAAIGTVVVLLTRDLTVLTIGGAVIGAGVGTYLIASWALITEIVPRAEAARYLGMANMATAGGSALARVLGGPLIDALNASGQARGIGYLMLYALAAVLFLASALAIVPLMLEEKRKREGNE